MSFSHPVDTESGNFKISINIEVVLKYKTLKLHMNKQYGRCKQVTNCRRVSKRKQARGNKI
jgi:hypothetical protein